MRGIVNGHRRRSAAEWYGISERYRQSGLGITEFCAQELPQQLSPCPRGGADPVGKLYGHIRWLRQTSCPLASLPAPLQGAYHWLDQKGA